MVKAGAESSAIFATLDFLPTFATLAGFDVPSDRVIDGVDQTELLLGRDPDGARKTFIYQAHISRSENTYTTNGLRKGKWKYLKAEHVVYPYARDEQRPKVVELYDLEADVGETTNLASKHPEIVAELQRELEAIGELDVLFKK